MSTFTATGQASAGQASEGLYLYAGESLTIELSGGSGIVELQKSLGTSGWRTVATYHAMGKFRFEQSAAAFYRLFARKVVSTITYEIANPSGDIVETIYSQQGKRIIGLDDEGTVQMPGMFRQYSRTFDNDEILAFPSNSPIILVPAEPNFILQPLFIFTTFIRVGDYANINSDLRLGLIAQGFSGSSDILSQSEDKYWLASYTDLHGATKQPIYYFENLDIALDLLNGGMGDLEGGHPDNRLIVEVQYHRLRVRGGY